MAKVDEFDAMYGDPLDDPLATIGTIEVTDRADPDQVSRILKARSKGYYERAKAYREDGKNARAEVFLAICKELAYLAKEIGEGRLDALEEKGK